MLTSFALYGVGVLSIIIFDVVYAKLFGSEDVAYWAEVKSFMMMLAPIFTLGVNALIVRSPEKKKAVLYIYKFVAAFILFSMLSIGLALEDVFYYILPVLFAFNLVSISVFRSESRLVVAQLIQNFWKICILLGVFLAYFDIYYFDVAAYCAITLLLSSCPIFLVSLYGDEKVELTDSVLSLKFLLSTFLSSASVYIEIYIASKIFTEYHASTYFIHYTLLTAVAMFVSGFLGFILTPSIKSKKLYFEGYFFNLRKMIIVILAIVSFIVFQYVVVGSFIELFYEEYAYNKYLAIIISTCVLVRILYVLPTSYLGALSNKNDFDQFLVASALSLCCMFFYYKLFLLFGFDEMLALAISGLLNWLVRFFYAYRSAFFLYRKLS